MKVETVVLLSLSFTCVDAYLETVELPDGAKPDIDICKNHAAKHLSKDMQWQGDLACLSAYWGKLPATNITSDDMAFFEEAQKQRFGFSPPPSGFRIRREVRTLSDTEWQAVTEVINTMNKRGILRKFGRLHGFALETAHKGAAFLPWHRVFLAHFEEEMRKINPAVSVPYWDYTIDNNITKPTDSVLWTECFFGNNNGTVQSGPFKNFYGANGGYIGRNANKDCGTRLINKIDLRNIRTHCEYQEITTGTGDYYANPHNLEVLHDGVHDWIGGDMSVVRNSAYDPIFWMHHAFVDYMFEEFRTKQQTECSNLDVETNYRSLTDLCQSCTDGYSHGHGPEEPMRGYSHLRNVDGLWLNWTTAFYKYEPAPSCPDRCYGKYLYCEKKGDPNSLCLTATREACKLPSVRVSREVTDKNVLEPRMSCYSGKKMKGYRGDGRTRDLSEEEARQILLEETGHDSKPIVSNSDTGSLSGYVIALIVVLCLSVILNFGLAIRISKVKRKTSPTVPYRRV